MSLHISVLEMEFNCGPVYDSGLTGLTSSIGVWRKFVLNDLTRLC